MLIESAIDSTIEAGVAQALGNDEFSWSESFGRNVLVNSLINWIPGAVETRIGIKATSRLAKYGVKAGVFGTELAVETGADYGLARYRGESTDVGPLLLSNTIGNVIGRGIQWGGGKTIQALNGRAIGAPRSAAGLVDDVAELAAQRRLIKMTGNTRNAHYLGKHSPLVFDQALINRATRGVDPWTGAVWANRRGQIANVDSTRFNSCQDMLESIQKAQRSFAAQYPGGTGIPSRGGTVTINMLRDVGVGYAKDTGVFRSGLTRVKVLFDEFGQVLSAYPLYR